MERKIIVTADNSKTLLVPSLNETYHSTKGALTESKHVFIQEGLHNRDLKQCNIFEMGFGTGLNAILTVDYAIRNKVRVTYHCIEAYPLSFEQVHQMGYLKLAQLEHLSTSFKQMHEAEHNTEIHLNDHFIFKKYINTMKDQTLDEDFYDLVYYDAFGPKVQAELWTVDGLRPIVQSMKAEGALVTYCAQGAFRRALRALDLEVFKIPGPPGKREMTRAIKPARF